MNPVVRSVILLIAAGCIATDCGAAETARKKPHVSSVVSANIDKDYRRSKNADGSYRAEYYALSFGGQAKGTTSHKSIDRVARSEFEALVKEQLAKQNYVMAPDAASASLLIHLLWGMTDPDAAETNQGMARNAAGDALAAYNKSVGQTAGDKGTLGIPNLTPDQREAESAAEGALTYMLLQDRIRERGLAETAGILGYIDPVNDLIGSPALHAGLGASYKDMWDEISERRFYVLIFAYDFKVLQRNGQLKPLWVTRVSIRAKGKHFDENLEAMLVRAGRYLGRPTHGLSRTIEGRVEMGETEVIGTVDEEPTESVTPPEDPGKPADPASSKPATTP